MKHNLIDLIKDIQNYFSLAIKKEAPKCETYLENVNMYLFHWKTELEQLSSDYLRRWIQKHLVEDKNDSGTVIEYENAIRLFLEKEVLGTPSQKGGDVSD